MINTPSKAPLFVLKLQDILKTSPESLVWWNEAGTSIIIKNIPQFSTKVIPKYYKHEKFQSFVRQLNFYGFRKVSKESILVETKQENTLGHPQLFESGCTVGSLFGLYLNLGDRSW